MFHRTLHTYILKELLRVFLLTASALTTLMAFGGMFKPLTKFGFEVNQLMGVLITLMPAMLAYAIPISALFAAVLVYWRMSTDNELTACRAGGISFVTIVLPACLLGFVVASVDLVFLNYVVPKFLQATERAIYRDLGSLLVSQIERQEKFQYAELVVVADSAELKPTPDPIITKVTLHGMAAAWLDRDGRPIATAVAQEADVTIKNRPGQDALEIEFSLTNATGFDPSDAFRRATGSIEFFSPDGKPIRVPSFFKSKPKFLNWKDLVDLRKDFYLFPPVAELVDRIEVASDYDVISRNAEAWWRTGRGPKGEIIFSQSLMRGSSSETVVYAPDVVHDPLAQNQESLSFIRKGDQPVVVEQWKLETRAGVATRERSARYECDAANLVLSLDTYSGTGIQAALTLKGNVTMESFKPDISKKKVEENKLLTNLQLPPAVRAIPRPAPLPNHDEKGQLVKDAEASFDPAVKQLGKLARERIRKLDRTITSELHSRASFALSCLTLVLLGAALGILLKGQNPLAVFVMGFVPAIILVLLITAGRQVTEGMRQSETFGLSLIWAGNAVLLALVIGAYSMLLRR